MIYIVEGRKNAKRAHQRKSNWIPVKIWTVAEDSYMAKVKESYTITKGNTYRVKATMTVWEGSQSETQTFYSE